jgi:hypothetical protein
MKLQILARFHAYYTTFRKRWKISPPKKKKKQKNKTKIGERKYCNPGK